MEEKSVRNIPIQPAIIGKRLRLVRKDELKLTQEEIAKKLERKPNYVSQLETGAKNVTFHVLDIYLNRFGVNPAYILRGLGEPLLFDYTKAFIAGGKIIETLPVKGGIYKFEDEPKVQPEKKQSEKVKQLISDKNAYEEGLRKIVLFLEKNYPGDLSKDMGRFEKDWKKNKEKEREQVMRWLREK